MPHIAPPVAPAVIGMNREERRRAELSRALRRAPIYLALAAGLHLGLLLWWWAGWKPPARDAPPSLVTAGVEDPPALDDLDEEEAAPPELEPPVPPPDDPQTVEDTQIEETPALEDVLDPGENILGLGAGGAGGGHGSRRHSALASGEIPVVPVGAGGSGFKSFVDDLRSRGLDLVFVVDATASMDKFIVQARAAIDDIIADVSAVVPDLRIGMVAYRDRKDAWLTQSVTLTDDRYRIHNFLSDLEALGGGDFEEAVEEGLRVAIHELPWRDGARRVLVLVGDAPPHETDEAAALALVRAFARDRDSVLDVLYTGARPGSEPTERDRATQAMLERLARTGNGVLTNLQAGQDDLRGLILDASFGIEWREDVQQLLARPRDDWRKRIVKDKVRRGDRAWLLENLDRPPVHPAVVDGCLQLFDASIAERALAILSDEQRSAAVRSVALYLLKRKVASGVVIDVGLPLAQQSAQLAALQRAVTAMAGAKRTTAPPPPPPPPQGGVPPGAALRPLRRDG